MNITITDHPAVARNPVDGNKPLTDNGKHVPLFPDLRAIRLDGKVIGYTGDPPKRAISFIIPNLPEPVIDAAKAAVAKEFEGVDSPVNQISPPANPTDADEFEGEDE